ncbi:endonuclease/exonuclease/phosphatase family protein [Jannaschia sp. R86511]|uniref:endonuclease/exonuclease/phosphatase family protein n=1 Tax=Jannaschia sp. R86511 TaxID=3093853 RepID=UPI0036D31CAA
MRDRLLLVTCVLLTLLGLGVPAASASVPVPPTRPVEYSLLQLNLCLSGLAGCFEGTRYPSGVEEAIEVIRAERPDAVTINEACSADVEQIAEQVGMEHRFSTVIYGGAPLPCRNPGERGVFGNAVLTSAGITSATDQAYEAQLGAEERRVLCVVTTDGVRTCTTHLSVAGTAAQAATNQAQCRELAAVLTDGPGRGATIAGGDVNRLTSCAPQGFWTLRDDQATQAVGIQHVYGSRGVWLRPQAEIVPLSYTDHDGLLVHALLRPGAGR